MAFYGYKGDADDYYQTPYYSCEYNLASTAIQASFPYCSSYEFNETKVIEYDSFLTPSVSVYTYTEPDLMPYSPMEYTSSSSSVNPSQVNYSVFHCTEPKLLQYDPAFVSSETNFTISYSTQEFNVPEFKEHNPNPYCGGYDPITTYGRPRSPSDEICYPRSTPQSDGLPYGKDDSLSTKPSNNSKETGTKTDLETDVPETGDSKVTSLGLDGEIGVGEALLSIPSDDSPEEKGGNGDYGDESEIQVHQIPYGSGLESMDLCESLFGYWPCLAKIEQQERDKRREICDQESRNDSWKIAADYLFGNPMVYTYENHHHHHHHHHHTQYQSYGNSWLR